MSVRGIIMIALAGLLLLGYLTVRYEKEPIEALLAQETAKALSEHEAGISVEQVSFDGRDATLKGHVSTETERRRVVQIVRDVRGVRVVKDLLVVDQPAVVLPPPAPTTRFRLDQPPGGAITLSGTVHSESARDQLVRAVEAAFPGTRVIDSLEVDPAIEKPAWFTSVLALIPTVGLVEHPRLEIDAGNTVIRLAGSVYGEPQRNVITMDAAQAVGTPYSLEADIQVREVEPVDEDPEVAAMRERIEELLRTTRIQFRINTAELVPLSRQVLDEVIAVLKEAPDLQIEVQGHTDNTGSNAMNRRLSQARADAVRDYLISKGIKAENLTAVGYGPTRPVATNTTKEGRIMNRRVVFRLKGGS